MLRSIETEDLQTILRWRNHLNVRQAMFTDHEISWDEHQSWWQRVVNDETQVWLMYEQEGQALGVVNFLGVGTELVDWGFYLSDELYGDVRQVIIWSTLEKEAIKYAFTRLKCHELIAKVFYFNKVVRKMHERFGFLYSNPETAEKNGATEEVCIMKLTADKYVEKK